MDYRLDEPVLEARIAELGQRRWLFDNIPLDPTHAEWLRRRAWVRTIHGTTRIEGNTLSDIEVDELLSGGGGRDLPRRDALEILGTRAALTFVDEIAPREGIPVDEAVIREIHRCVLRGQSALLTPGEYRRGENRVVDAHGKTVFTTPPSGDVPSLMRAFGTWSAAVTGRHPAPVAAALAHLEFVAIHPFNDGNGQTARALSRLFLLRHGYAFGGLVSLDAYFDQDRTSYFGAIRASIGRSYTPGYDATRFVAYFLSSLIGAVDHVLGRVRGLGQMMIAIRRDIASGVLPAPMIDGLAYAWVNRYLRPADYIRLTGRSPQATTRDLGIATRAGYLIAAGERRGRIYGLGPKLLSVRASGEIATLAASVRSETQAEARPPAFVRPG